MRNTTIAIRMLMYLYHNVSSLQDRSRLIQAFQAETVPAFDAVIQAGPNPTTKFFKEDKLNPLQYNCKKFIRFIYDFVSVGYATTLGWAWHAHSGDTMTAVRIGGLRAVRNGHSEVFCGDTIQWHWPLEQQCFDNQGRPGASP